MAIGILDLGLAISVMLSIQCFCDGFTPTDNYLINCGSSISTAVGDRNFLADLSLSSTLTTPTSIMANTTLSSGVSALYQTARVFTGPSSYSFVIKAPGRHFVRLYFFPFVYGSYDLTVSNFSVSTQDVLLLNNFRPQSNSSVVKEFSLSITGDTLILSFAPSGSSPLAFVNAVEVVSVPDDLIQGNAQIVGRKDSQSLSGQALETVYRLNVGGQQVLSVDDTLWRTWETDLRYLLNDSSSATKKFSGRLNYMQGGATQESAPDAVYSTARRLVPSNTSREQIDMTWKLDVDAKFSYLMRFHFCDIVSKAAGDLYFNVSVGRWPILRNFDLSSEVFRSLATPYFTDFVVDATDAPSELSVSVSSSYTVAPDGTLKPPSGILNGLEIMKMNFSISSPFIVPPSSSKKNLGIILGSVIGSLTVVAVAIVLLLVLRRRKPAIQQVSETWTPFSTNDLSSQSTTDKTSTATPLISEQSRNSEYRIPFVILQEATNNFDESLLIGFGGFGKVYKGVLKDQIKVAVKRGSSKHKQGIGEFHNEIEFLSQLRHRHLVTLIGYCDEKNEMILVYEYMENGTLKNQLYGSNLPSLSWKQRLEICIGAARGLHYLHTSSTRAIIHRDVKSANILLDENLLAKVSDFGLSKAGPELDQTHVSTAVKGSFGYLDPEYFRMQRLTEKSDVYSFGVVLLEVLCARQVIDPTLPREMVNLADWGLLWQRKRELEQIVDPRIAGTIRIESLRKFGNIIEKCLADYGVDRPSMADVLWNLEYVLLLQESDSSVSEINSIKNIAELAPAVQNITTTEDAPAKKFDASGMIDYSDVSMDKVFSQIISAEGR